MEAFLASWLPELSLTYGLRLADIVGDTTQPGLTLDQLLGYVRHYGQRAARLAAGQEDVTGDGAGRGKRARLARDG